MKKERMKIKNGKPLPDHTKLDYYECYAKVILEDLFADRYGKLIISDKPDLQNENLNIAVEVTSAVPREHREAVELWCKSQYADPKQKEKNIERMKQLNVEYTEGIQFWNSETISDTQIEGYPIEEFIKSYCSKLRKLNERKYKKFACYDLFVLSELYVPNKLCDIVLNALLSKNYGNINFSRVILHEEENIITFDLLNKTYNKVKFIDKQYSFAVQARKMVELEEENDKT